MNTRISTLATGLRIEKTKNTKGSVQFDSICQPSQAAGIKEREKVLSIEAILSLGKEGKKGNRESRLFWEVGIGVGVGEVWHSILAETVRLVPVAGLVFLDERLKQALKQEQRCAVLLGEGS